MNEIEQKFQNYHQQFLDLQKQNISVYEFYKKALEIENNFYKVIQEANPSDNKGKYAKCVIIGKYAEFEYQNMLNSLESLPQELKNCNIQDYYRKYPQKNISISLNNFTIEFSHLKNLSEEQAKKLYEEKCQETHSQLSQPFDFKVNIASALPSFINNNFDKTEISR